MILSKEMGFSSKNWYQSWYQAFLQKYQYQYQYRIFQLSSISISIGIGLADQYRISIENLDLLSISIVSVSEKVVSKVSVTYRLWGIIWIVLMSPFSWLCQNLCLLSLAFIIDWRVVSMFQFQFSIANIWFFFNYEKSQEANFAIDPTWMSCPLAVMICCAAPVGCGWWPGWSWTWVITVWPVPACWAVWYIAPTN